MEIRGAGGTEGGTGKFLLGLVMMVGGGYLFLQNIQVHMGFGLALPLWYFGTLRMTSGMVLIPLMLGIGTIFYNAKSWAGWLVTGASLVMLGFGIISQLQMNLRSMSAFDLLVILTLLVGGAGLFLSSLRRARA